MRRRDADQDKSLIPLGDETLDLLLAQVLARVCRSLGRGTLSAGLPNAAVRDRRL
jgi:hypothetical protein